MAFRLHPSRPTGREIARIASERLAAIRRSAAAGGDLTKRIHAARTTCKKLRALLRLGPAWPKPAVQRECDRLKHAARRLAEFRDVDAMLGACRALATTHRRDRAALTALRRQLAGHRKVLQADPRKVEAALVAVARDLERTLAQVRTWPAGTNDITPALPALKAAYRRARRRAAGIDRDAPAADYHRWRKAVKRLGYHSLLLGGACPGVGGAWGRRVGRLGDLLGRDHDLAVLREFIRGTAQADSRQLTAAENRTLALIDRRQHTARRAARRLAKRIFTAKPKAYVRRIKRQWRAAAPG